MSWKVLNVRTNYDMATISHGFSPKIWGFHVHQKWRKQLSLLSYKRTVPSPQALHQGGKTQRSNTSLPTSDTLTGVLHMWRSHVLTLSDVACEPCGLSVRNTRLCSTTNSNWSMAFTAALLHGGVAPPETLDSHFRRDKLEEASIFVIACPLSTALTGSTRRSQLGALTGEEKGHIHAPARGVLVWGWLS